MSSRVIGSRFSQFSRRSIRTPFRKPVGRRYQSTDAAAAAPAQSFVSRIWNSPVGVKTVHFWAPVMKWAIVLAGINDLARPAEKLSLTQNLALTATGTIWTRWCFVIRPRNILLATVNFFLATVGIVQVSRILLYQQSVKNSTLSEVAESNTKDAAETAKSIAENPKGAAKVAVNG
ncbi:MAG: hypothetical protein LQ342_002833 [Letrouitia transgressa]|nr:MAG: hypothetical protein LQ342_002833 [Letrouitia transgressa]